MRNHIKATKLIAASLTLFAMLAAGKYVYAAVDLHDRTVTRGEAFAFPMERTMEAVQGHPIMLADNRF